MTRLVTLFILLINSLITAQEHKAEIHFSKNVELAGYLIHLAEPLENDPDHPISIELNKHRKDLQNPSLALVFESAADMTYAFIIRLLFQLPEYPLASGFDTERFLNQHYGYKTSEEFQVIRKLIHAINEFSKTSDFPKIWDYLESYRTQVLSVLKTNAPTPALLSRMEEVYQKEFETYEIIPSFTLWATAGWGFENPEEHRATFILGPLALNYDFSDTLKFENLAIHEFGHSFVNAAVLNNPDLIEETQALFTPLQESMYDQGYHDWESCLIEHFVRAGEIWIPETLGDHTQTNALKKEYIQNRNFKYLPQILEKLKHYRLQQGAPYEEAVRLTLKDLSQNQIPPGK